MGEERYPERCGDCGSLDVVTDYSQGDIVCRGCGMILGERIIDDTPEWRNFANDDRGGDPASKSRVGESSDQRFEDESSSLTSYLVDLPSQKSSNCAEDDRPTQFKRPRLNKESAKVRRMQSIVARIQQIADVLSLPKSIVEVALDVYAEVENKEFTIRGSERDSVPAAVLFIACRKMKNARTMKELETASGVEKRQIGKTFLSLSKVVDMEIHQATTEDYVHRFCSRLGLPTKIQVVANNVAKKADTLGLSTGKSPIAVAASVIYLVAAYTDAKRSLQEITDVTMIGEKNVKVVCRELNKNRIVLFEGVVLT